MQSDLTLLIKAVDEASQTINKVQKELKDMENAANTVGTAGQSMGNQVGGGLGKIKPPAEESLSLFGRLKKGVSSTTSKIGAMGNAMMGLFGGNLLSSLWELTIGTAMENQQMESLLASTMKNKQAAKELSKTCMELTQNSMLMPQELTKAMAILKMSTGITNDQLKQTAPLIRDIGQNFALQGWTGKQLVDYMSSSLDGLNGQFQKLSNNLGITKEKLMKAGWKGTDQDVEGYWRALAKVSAAQADLSGAMDNTQGRLVLAQNRFRVFCNDLGSLVLPVIDKVLQLFLSLDDETQHAIMILGLVAVAIIGIITALAPLIYVGTVIGLVGSGILLLIIAVVGLIAVLVYLYNTNENFRQSVNNAIQPLQDFWNWLCEVTKPAQEFIDKLIHGKLTLEEFAEGVGWVIGTIIGLPFLLVRIGLAFWRWLISLAPAAGNALSNLAKRIWSELCKIPGKIRAAIPAAIRAAIAFGKGIIKGILGAMGIHSPGIIQKSVVAEFANISGRIRDEGIRAKRAAVSFGKNILGGAGAAGFGYSIDGTRKSELVIIHDLRNVPAGINEERLAALINDTNSDGTFAKALSNSFHFQNHDADSKLRLSRLNKRNMGI